MDLYVNVIRHSEWGTAAIRLISDIGNYRIRRVWPDGTITTVVGTGEPGFSGDGGVADQALLNQPKAIAVLPDLQGFLLADAGNSRIRLVSVDLR